MNVVTAAGMFGLLVTGPLIWLRRRLKRRGRPEREPALASQRA
jgi:hypothetical protein